MQLHNVSIGHRVIGPNLLAVGLAASPDARELERAGDIVVHQPRNLSVALRFGLDEYRLGHERVRLARGPSNCCYSGAC